MNICLGSFLAGLEYVNYCPQRVFLPSFLRRCDSDWMVDFEGESQKHARGPDVSHRAPEWRLPPACGGLVQRGSREWRAITLLRSARCVLLLCKLQTYSFGWICDYIRQSFSNIYNRCNLMTMILLCDRLTAGSSVRDTPVMRTHLSRRNSEEMLLNKAAYWNRWRTKPEFFCH